MQLCGRDIVGLPEFGSFEGLGIDIAPGMTIWRSHPCGSVGAITGGSAG